MGDAPLDFTPVVDVGDLRCREPPARLRFVEEADDGAVLVRSEDLRSAGCGRSRSSRGQAGDRAPPCNPGSHDGRAVPASEVRQPGRRCFGRSECAPGSVRQQLC